MQVRKRIEIAGIVQGVGFRPYVYRLATEAGLAGFVTNTTAGVLLEVQGSRETVDRFLHRLPAEAPPLARIVALEARDLACNGEVGFRILSSRAGIAPHVLIAPDVALCDDCLRELFDPADRRYRYPFINCTNCGPRFTIVRDIPYDRASTSMSVFPMCAACQAEYDDPANRRFHAQPNACWDCGPRVALRDAAGRPVPTEDPIFAAAEQLQAGGVVAVKGLGGFHLACDATNPQAVARLREGKRRVEKPFAVMTPDVAAAERLCEISAAECQLLLSAQRPIVLLRKREGIPVAEGVAPRNHYLGVFLPYTPLHHLVFAAGGFAALVMTSGNLSEEPIAIENDEAVARLRGVADFFLMHDRSILLRCDDSVVRVAAGRPRQLRRSRGYVPVPVFLHEEVPPILAVGGELKNTVCLARGTEAFLSQHIGDLENLESYRFFEETVAHLQRILEIEPEILACDLHPDYFSTRWAAQQRGVEIIGVQHHHAHIASCMAENHLEGPVIGFALDGTGYGTDGAVWGGEVLLADYAGFRRAAHFRYVPMPGGAAAIREPWRMAVSCLAQHFGKEFFNWHIPFVAQLERSRTRKVLSMAERGINAPLTSSCGRLFDAVAALAGLRQTVNYEAQAAIELEMCMEPGAAGDAYPFALSDEQHPWQIETRPMFEALANDLRAGVSAGVISRRFHDGLVSIFTETALRLREREDLNRVCLSGGTFQNVYLLEQLSTALAARGFEVFTHSEVPAGDGGLSLGQVMVAAHACRRAREVQLPLAARRESRRSR